MATKINIEAEIQNCSDIQATTVKFSLQALAKNLTPDNLAFLAELSSRTGVNKKLESKKSLIKNWL